VIRSFTIIVAIAAAAGAQAAAEHYTPAPTFSGPHPAVARIVVPERGGASLGSGTLVAVNESSGLVLTNWHVVRDAGGQITVLFPDGFRSGAYLLRTDRDWDLAALAIRRPNVQPVAISNEAPRPGETVTIAGYGSGSYRAVSGQVTQYVSPGDNQPFEMIELSAPARNGDSGGPILNTRGELAGTLFGSSFGRTTGSYCGRLRWFLNSVEGDFQRISAQALIAQQSHSNVTPLAAIPSTNQVASGAPLSPSLPIAEAPRTNPGGAETSVAPAASCSSSNASHIQAPPAAIPTRPAGPLPTSNQLKTIFAAIGVLAVFYHALRLLGRAVG
jgi:hypothetical protein